jgi:hypothetical protein
MHVPLMQTMTARAYEPALRPDVHLGLRYSPLVYQAKTYIAPQGSHFLACSRA